MVEKSEPKVKGLVVRQVVDKNKVRDFSRLQRGGKRAAVKVDLTAPRPVLPAGKIIFIRGLRNSAVGNATIRKGVVGPMSPADAMEAIRAGVGEFVKAEDVAAAVAEVRKEIDEKAKKAAAAKSTGKPAAGKILSPEEAEKAWGDLKTGMTPADYLAKEPKGRFAKAAKLAIEAMA